MIRRDIITAVPTAFSSDGTLDIAGSRAIYEHVATSGNEGAFVLGTTGEFIGLEENEFARLIDVAVEVLSPHMRVIVHVGAASSYQAVRRVKLAREAGAKEFAALTPYYMSVSDGAIFEYFVSIAEAVGDGSLYIYVYPARAGNTVTPTLLARLAGVPNIVGAKCSELSLEQVAEYRQVVPDDFILYTGSDRELALAAHYGAQGVVSGVSSVTPKPFRALARAAEEGGQALPEAQQAVDDVVSAIGGRMPHMKWAYRKMGIVDSTVRLPLDEPTTGEEAEIERVLRLYA